MNNTVSNFYGKDVPNYANSYRLDHSPRLQAVINRYGLKQELAGKKVADVGGGLGFLGELLDPTTDYWVIDGADISPEQRLCKGHWVKQDLDHDEFSLAIPFEEKFDAVFCQETLEHCGNPHHVLAEIKWMTKIGAPIFLSIPTEAVTHNTPYPTLLWPHRNFELFLAQMALLPADFWTYTPSGRGWPAYCYRCENRPWSEKQMLFPKDEGKFLGATPLECTNL